MRVCMRCDGSAFREESRLNPGMCGIALITGAMSIFGYGNQMGQFHLWRTVSICESCGLEVDESTEDDSDIETCQGCCCCLFTILLVIAFWGMLLILIPMKKG